MSHQHRPGFVVVLALRCPSSNDGEANRDAVSCMLRHAVKGHGMMPMEPDEMRAYMEAGGGIGTVLGATEIIDHESNRNEMYELLGERDIAELLGDDDDDRSYH
jgi:hypothetical protein